MKQGHLRRILGRAVCIATGFIFFVEKCKKQHAKAGGQGSRTVDALAVTAITGMVIAAMAMLVANRLLPADLAGVADFQRYAFWGAWVLSMAHAFWRSAPVAQARMNPACREQSWTVAVLAIAAVVLNWGTTGDHLIRTVFTAGGGRRPEPAGCGHASDPGCAQAGAA